MLPDEWNLNTIRIGRRVLYFDQVDSTNTVAARLADDPANDGVAVLAGEQTAGRGQHGRRWQCRRGDGVLLSVLLFPPPMLRRPAVLTAWAVVAVCEMVQRLTGLQPRIKWPNDVLVRGRNNLGILIEQGRAAVAGIGLNVCQPPEYFAAAGLPHGASLAQFTDTDLDARTAAEMLLRRMDEEYTRLPGGRLGDAGGELETAHRPPRPRRDRRALQRPDAPWAVVGTWLRRRRAGAAGGAAADVAAGDGAAFGGGGG